jgi:hypothetical protein
VIFEHTGTVLVLFSSVIFVSHMFSDHIKIIGLGFLVF